MMAAWCAAAASLLVGLYWPWHAARTVARLRFAYARGFDAGVAYQIGQTVTALRTVARG